MDPEGESRNKSVVHQSLISVHVSPLFDERLQSQKTLIREVRALSHPVGEFYGILLCMLVQSF